LLDSENGEELKEKVRAGESEESWGGWLDDVIDNASAD
jgi:hypothetical protein